MRDQRSSPGLALAGSLLPYRRPVPALLPAQVQRFTLDALRARPVRRFNPRDVLGGLRAGEGKTILAIDIGGDKLSASYFAIRDGGIMRTGNGFTCYGNGGIGYLDVLRTASQDAQREQIPVGISFAGPTDGTRLLAGPNLPVFIEEFQESCESDFANLFPVVEVANDAEAGIMAGALEAVRRYPGAQHVIYVINGSGLGGSVLTENMIYAAEPGHIEVAEQLNAFGQRRACGLDGAPYVCVEAVAASKAGVEDIWFQRTGEHLTGKEIASRYLDHDSLALALYDYSAQLTAHVVKGMAAAFQVLSHSEQLAIVGHGGIFNVFGYGERLSAILGRDLGKVPQALFTKDFSANACLEGAAIAVASWIS